MVKQKDVVEQPASPEVGVKSIDYYGAGVDNLLEASVKLTTVRKSSSKYRGFKVGDSITANCVDAEISTASLVIWGVLEDVPLDTVDLALLNLDGFTSVKQAVENLKMLPGYEDMTKKPPVSVIATVSQETFDWLTPEQQGVLLAQKKGLNLSEVVRQNELQALIRYSIASWEWLRGGNAENWLLRFLFLNLITKNEFDALHRYHASLQNPVFGDQYMSEYLFTQGQALNPDLFNLFVLADITKIPSALGNSQT